MSIDPSKFHLVNVADTCAVWHILSSQRLYNAAKEAKCDFCMTEFVKYECFFKPRQTPIATDQMLRQRLAIEREHGAFKAHACSIDDLQAIKLLEQRKRLGKGELSSIAFAMKIRQAVITDDQKARKLAIEAGHELVQTTPHLFSWLIFTGCLCDSDKSLVIGQHKELGQSLAPHFERAYIMALEYRLNSQVRGEEVPS
jgi:hypothetical protein